MKPYSPFMSTGMRLLNNLAKGKYASSDIYWAHAPLSAEDKPDVLLITDRYSVAFISDDLAQSRVGYYTLSLRWRQELYSDLFWSSPTLCKTDHLIHTAEATVLWRVVARNQWLSLDSNWSLLLCSRILYLERCKWWGDWDIEFDVLLDDIIGIPAITGNKMAFKVRQVSSKPELHFTLDFFVSSAKSRKRRHQRSGLAFHVLWH